MSLVNNMLKDLDQRRKSSDSTGAAADLVPASDSPRSGKSRILIFFSLLLVGVGGGYAYLMFEDIELWDMEISESLNIIPDRVALPAERVQPETSSTDNSASAVDNSSGSSGFNQQAPVSQAASNPVNTENPGIASEAPDTAVAANNSSAPGFSSPAATVNDFSLLQPSPLESIPGLEPELEPVNDSSVSQGQSGADGNTTDGVAQAEVLQQENAGQTAAQQTPPSMNLPPSESVKDYAAMTPEEQDTLAVQFALRLIAANESIAAYTSLEQHIMQNRYAHQSRETYGKLLVNDGEYLAARNVIESGLSLAPNHAGFKKIKARILIANGALTEAVDLLSSRAPSINEDVEYHEILATAQLASRDYSGALNSYTQLVRLDRRQGRWWYGFAASQESLGNREAARQGYDQALQQSNLSPNLRRRIQERLTVLNP